MKESPFLLIKDFQTQLNNFLSPMDVYAMPTGLQKAITALKRETIDARLDIQDYELSETRQEQLKHAKSSRQRLADIKGYILAASQGNIFGPVDVAQLTAQLEHINDRIV